MDKTQLVNQNRSLKQKYAALFESSSPEHDATTGTLTAVGAGVLAAVADGVLAGRTGNVEPTTVGAVVAIGAGYMMESRELIRAGHVMIGISAYNATKTRMAAAWT